MTAASTNGGGAYPPPPIPTKTDLEAAGIRVVLGIPMERVVTDVAFVAFWEIAMRGWSLVRRHYGRKDVNRNRFAQTLLDSDFTHLLMLDLDHIHPPNVVEHHARWVLEDPARLVVGGLHFRRGEPYDPCMYLRGSDGRLHAPADWGDGLYPVEAMGFGSVLIHRSAFEKLPKPWFANDYSLADQDGWPGEDMWFSHLCRAHGIGLWVDTTMTSGHLIPSIVDQDTYRGYLADHPELVAGDHITVVSPQNGEQAVQVPDIKTRVEA